MFSWLVLGLNFIIASLTEVLKTNWVASKNPENQKNVADFCLQLQTCYFLRLCYWWAIQFDTPNWQEEVPANQSSNLLRDFIGLSDQFSGESAWGWGYDFFILVKEELALSKDQLWNLGSAFVGTKAEERNIQSTSEKNFASKNLHFNCFQEHWCC